MENNLLLAILVLLAASVVLVPLAKLAGLGTILGYLAAGVLVGPYGLRLIADTELIAQVSEFGIVLMLFLIGLELQPSELWRMRHRVLGLGLSQLALTAGILALAVIAAGLSWQTGIIVGLALAMSSTAIAMQSAQQRDITKTDTGRASLDVLLVQDVSVIPILAAIPILGSFGGTGSMVGAEVSEAMEAIADPIDWLTPLYIVGAFALAVIAGRFLVRPMMHFVARARVREIFTALALALVVGAALATQYLGLSPALGAFLAGVLLADSEYRHELISDLEPFKGLLLGLFFISVGMSIAFSVIVAEPFVVFALVCIIVIIKMAVLFGIASAFRMHLADRLLLAVLLSQAGEFAFVILQFAASSGSLTSHDYALLTAVVAFSMATTPLLLFAFDRLTPRLHGAIGREPETASLDAAPNQPVIVLGYGRFGQIVTRMLRAQGYRMTLIDDDPAQIETVKRFGVKVFYGDGGRLDLLEAAGARDARMIVIAVAGAERILSIAAMIRRHFPHVKIAARAIDRSHAHELMALGVEVFERETFRSAVGLGTKALIALGYAPDTAQQLARAFEEHDNRLLQESYHVRHDEMAYIGLVRHSMDMLEQVMRADIIEEAPAPDADPADDPSRLPVDNASDAASE